MNAKSNLKYMFEMYKQSINTQKFILIFLLSICFAFYGIVVQGFTSDYAITFLTIISGGWYCGGLLLIMLLNTNNIYYLFEKNKFYVIRCGSKKKYLIELIRNICFSNFMLFIINMMLIMIGLNLFNNYHVETAIKTYEISRYLYLIYAVIKLLLFIFSISVINVFLYKLIGSTITTIGNIACYILVVYTPVNVKTISSITKLPLFIGTYLNGLYFNYSSFAFEVICSLLYLAILLVLIVILFKITYKKMRDIA